MYIESNAPIITLTRGDTIRTPIFINKGTRLKPLRYQLQEGDYLYFGIFEPNKHFENSIVRKKYDMNSPVNDYGDVIIELNPQDTEFLRRGTYYYCVKLRQFDDEDNEYVTTVIPPTLFYIV